MSGVAAGEQGNGAGSDGRIWTAVFVLRRSETAPTDSTSKTKLVEPLRRIIFDPQREDFRFPCGGLELIAVEQFENRFHASDTFHAVFRIDALPREEKTLELG